MINTVNADYLIRLNQRMSDEDVDFVMLCPPLHPRFKPHVQRLKRDAKDLSLPTALMTQYFESVEFVSESDFCDTVHLYRPEEFRDRFHRFLDAKFESSDWQVENRCCLPEPDER